MSRQTFLDTCGLAHPVTYIAYKLGLYDLKQATILRSIRAEIARLSISPVAEKRDAACRAALTILKLQQLPTVRVTLDRRPPLNSHPDEDILARAKDVGGRIVTEDRDLQEIARVHNLQVIAVQDLCLQLQSIVPELTVAFPFYPALFSGQTFITKVVEKGAKDDQGIAYLNNQKIFVKNAAAYIDHFLEIRLSHIHPSANGHVDIFAEPVHSLSPNHNHA